MLKMSKNKQTKEQLWYTMLHNKLQFAGFTGEQQAAWTGGKHTQHHQLQNKQNKPTMQFRSKSYSNKLNRSMESSKAKNLFVASEREELKEVWNFASFTFFCLLGSNDNLVTKFVSANTPE